MNSMPGSGDDTYIHVSCSVWVVVRREVGVRWLSVQEPVQMHVRLIGDQEP